MAKALAWHLMFSLVALTVGTLLALTLAQLSRRWSALGRIIGALTASIRATPSIAWIALVPAVLGVSLANRYVFTASLTLLTAAWISRYVRAGFAEMPPDARAYAHAIGVDARTGLRQLDLPVAMPQIATGVRIAASANVALVALAALMKIPGLGALFVSGYQQQEPSMVLAGVGLCVLLALTLDLILRSLARHYLPWTRKGAL